MDLFKIESLDTDIANPQEKLPGVKHKNSPVSEKYRETFEQKFA